MKTKMMKQMVGCLLALVLMAGWAGFGQPAAVEAASGPSLTVTEVWSDPNLYFTVTNGGYTDIREFAIGNNDAQWAWVDTGLSSPPTNLTEGRIAIKHDSGWQTSTSAGWRDLIWMNNATGFGDYTAAFLFTSWGWNGTEYSGYLDDGFTNGYSGSTEMPSSPFAAYSVGEGTITGETSIVPIPGALWLLGSGLLGLIGIRRKFQ